jgi:hypothetical protein
MYSCQFTVDNLSVRVSSRALSAGSHKLSPSHLLHAIKSLLCNLYTITKAIYEFVPDLAVCLQFPHTVLPLLQKSEKALQ